MFKYFKMKKLETELKFELYSYATFFLKEKRDIIHITKNLYGSLKHSDPNQLLDKIIYAIATIAHEESRLEKDKEEEK